MAVRWLAQTRQRWALGGVVVLLLVALGSLEGVLADMHLPGTARATITGVANPLTNVGDARTLLEVWDDWTASTSLTGQHTVGPWAAWWLTIDSVFAVCLGALIGLVAWVRRARVATPAPPERSAASGVVALLWTVPWVAAGYVVFDLAENLCTWLAIRETDPTWRTTVLWVVRIASAAKWIAVAAAVAPIAVSFVACRDVDRDGRRSVVATALHLRAQVVTVAVVVAVLVALPGNVRPQLHDLVLDWTVASGAALAAVVAVVGLTVVLWISGVHALSGAGEGPTSDAASLRRIVVVGGAGGVLVFVGLVVEHLTPVRSGVAGYVVGAVLIAWAVLSGPGPVRRIENHRPPFTRRPGVLRVLTVLPLYALLVAWLRSTVPVLDASSLGLALAGVAGLAVVLGAWAVVWRLPATGPDRGPGVRGVVGLTVAMTGVVPLAVAAAAPLTVAPALGGVALLAMAGFVVLGGLSATMALLHGPPRAALALVGFRRVPVVSAVLVVGVIAALFAEDPGFHRARLIDAASPRPSEPVTVELAFDAWLDAPVPPGDDTEGDTGSVADGEREWRPLLVVSSSGGGGRALYWTLLTMNCLFADEPDLAAPACGAGADHYSSMFAASGISGGSVGLAMFASDPTLRPDEAFGSGFIEPVVANLLAIDVPNAIVQSPAWRDRAAVLERAWEDGVTGFDQPFLDRWRHLADGTEPDDPGGAGDPGDPWDPLLLLNSSAVEDGCRLNVSTLAVAAAGTTTPATPPTLSGSCRAFTDLQLGVPSREADGLVLPRWAATRDLTSVLCVDDDLRMSTAALLSARFPYVSPSGAIEYCDSDGRYTFLIDGGALDASGAGPATLLLDEVATRAREHNLANPDAPCVQPIVLQIDNGYEDLVSVPRPSRPRETLAPIIGGLRAITANAEMARQQLAELGSTMRDRSGCAEVVPDIPTFLHVYPQSHPGVKAPLGWSLSQRSRDDMAQQLARTENQCALLTVRYWLTGATGGQTCVAGTLQDVAEPPAAIAGTLVCWADRDGDTGTDDTGTDDTGTGDPAGRGCARTDAFGGFVLVDERDALPADPTDLIVAPDDASVAALDDGYRHATAGRELAFDVRFGTVTMAPSGEPDLGPGHVVLILVLLGGFLGAPAAALTAVAWRRWNAASDL